MDSRIQHGADLLETPLEDLRTVIDAWLKKLEKPARAAEPAGAGPGGGLPQLYLIYDKRDATAVAPWADFLFKDFEVIPQVFDGDESEIRTYHEESLRSCNGALIFYGSANECWLRGKLRELQKTAAYRQDRRKPVIGIAFIAPRTPAKEQFRTHDALLMPQWDGLSPDALQRFVSQLKPNPQTREGDGTDQPS
jgi:hypothetical protein